MSDKQTVVPDPAAHERMGAPEIDLVAVKLSDTGRVRPHNEDYVDYLFPPDPQLRARKGAIYLVADGMGGHRAGEVASRAAVELVTQRYYEDPSRDVGKSLVRAIQAANQQIHAQAQADPSKTGMGTTLVAAVVLGRRVYVANVGDSRAYLINSKSISQITEDHSWVEEQLRAGLLTREQAKRHPQRNLVTRALGSKPAVDVDLFEGEISKGDMLLLCSDGLSGRVEDQEIAAIARDHPPQEAARLLVAAANERGGNDNITVLIVSTEERAAVAATKGPAAEERAPARRSLLIPGLVGGVAIVALALGILWATGLLFGGEPTPTPLPAVTTVLETSTLEVSPAGDVGTSPLPTVPVTHTLAPGEPTSTLAPTSTGTPAVTPTSSLPLPTLGLPTALPTLPRPSLTSPLPSVELKGTVRFEWTYSGTLGQNQAFQVLIWKEGETDHQGAAQSRTETWRLIALDAVPQLVAGGAGRYYWSVVVVDRNTDERLSAEATARSFIYPGLPAQATPTSTPTNTLPPTKIPLLSTWTPTPSDTPTATDTPTDTDAPTPTDTTPQPLVSGVPDVP